MISWLEDNSDRLRVVACVFSMLAALYSLYSVVALFRDGAEIAGKLTTVCDRRNDSVSQVVRASVHCQVTDEMWTELQSADLQYRRELPVLAAGLVGVAVDITSELEGGILKARIKSAR